MLLSNLVVLLFMLAIWMAGDEFWFVSFDVLVFMLLLYLIRFVIISLILTLLILFVSDGIVIVDAVDEFVNGGELIDVKWWSFDDDLIFFFNLLFWFISLN